MTIISDAEDNLDGALALPRQSFKPPGVVRVAMRMWRTRIGLIITAALVFLAFCGRYFAPFGETEFIGIAMQPANSTKLHESTVFGTGKLGFDIWTRFLYGGRPILITAFLATVLALVLGTTIGLIAAYNRGKLDDVLMRGMDIILAFPQIILALVVIAMFGATNTLIILTVGVSTTPRPVAMNVAP